MSIVLFASGMSRALACNLLCLCSVHGRVQLCLCSVHWHVICSCVVYYLTHRISTEVVVFAAKVFFQGELL